MSLNSVLRSLACMAYAASASPVTGAENQISRISLPLNVSHASTSPSILSTPSSSVSTKSALNITCDGAQYGDNLNVADCKDARDYIGSGPFEFAWVERTHFLQKPHFWLPYRYMGGRYFNENQLGVPWKYRVSTFAKSQQISDTVISRWVWRKATTSPTLASIKSKPPPMRSCRSVGRTVLCKGAL